LENQSRKTGQPGAFVSREKNCGGLRSISKRKQSLYCQGKKRGDVGFGGDYRLWFWCTGPGGRRRKKGPHKKKKACASFLKLKGEPVMGVSTGEGKYPSLPGVGGRETRFLLLAKKEDEGIPRRGIVVGKLLSSLRGSLKVKKRESTRGGGIGIGFTQKRGGGGESPPPLWGKRSLESCHQKWGAVIYFYLQEEGKPMFGGEKRKLFLIE